MTDKQVKQLAEGLSEAQRYSVLRMRGKDERGDANKLAAMLVGALPTEPKPPRQAIQALERKGLAKSIFCGGWIDWLTEDGLACRQYLKDNQHG